MMLRSSSMIRSEKLQRRNCPTSMRMVSPSWSRRRAPDRRLSDHDRPVGFDDFQRADPFVVIAQDFQQHIAARSGRKEDVVFLEQTGIVRDQIFGLGRLELKAAAHRAGAPPEIEQVHLAVVVENDLVLERRFHLGPGLELDAVQHGIDVAQRFDPHFQSERHFQRAFPRTRALELHFIGILVHAHKNLRQRDVLLRVEIRRQLLVGEKLIADQDALPGINPAKTAAQKRPAAHRNRLAGVVLEQDQIVITEGEQAIVPAQAFQGHVRRAVRSEGKRFERGRPALVDRRRRNLPRRSVGKRCRSPAPPCPAAT